eukprot:1185320-Prorocentrum_minimum.AAC.3
MCASYKARREETVLGAFRLAGKRAYSASGCSDWRARGHIPPRGVPIGGANSASERSNWRARGHILFRRTIGPPSESPPCNEPDPAHKGLVNPPPALVNPAPALVNPPSSSGCALLSPPRAVFKGFGGLGVWGFGVRRL